MRIFLEIAYTGVVAVLLYPLRSVITVLCLVAVLVPYLAGLGISQGIQHDANLSLQEGADLYVSGSQFGQQTAIPLSAIQDIRAIDGVVDVTPRIVGPIVLGLENVPAVLVGIPAGEVPLQADSVEGRLFRDDDAAELVVGSTLAKRLRVVAGDRLPPFYRSTQGERVSTVVGVFRADTTYWQSHLIFTSLKNAGQIFDQPNMASEVLVKCRPGYEESVRERIRTKISFQTDNPQIRIRPRVISRTDLKGILSQVWLHREGVFNLHFVLAFSVAILVVVVTSGVGLTDRRREIAILKASGWQTDEVLLRAITESVLLSLLGALVSVVLSFVWLKWLNGYYIAAVFLDGVKIRSDVPIPFRLTPLPVLFAVIISFVVVIVGTLYSTWRTATAPPRTVMR